MSSNKSHNKQTHQICHQQTRWPSIRNSISELKHSLRYQISLYLLSVCWKMYSCVCACAWMCRCRRQDVQVLIEASRHISVGCLLYLFTHYTHHWRSQMFSLKTNKIQWPNWCITVDYELWRLVEERRRILDHYIFALSFLSSIYLLLFFPRLISAAADWMSTILLHMAWP